MPPIPTTIYTTIPISAAEVISRSAQNLSAALSRRRPWPEFLSSLSLSDLPASVSAAYLRFCRNSAYFSVNYALVLAACAAASLFGTPLSLLTIGFVFFLWLIFHFFREDPLVILGRHVSDWAVILGLGVVTVAALWATGPLNSMSVGIGVGLLIAVAHGVLRNPEGIFLDENDAASNGLIVSNSRGGGVSIDPPV